MTYRFLPWVRRGLASEIASADALSGPISTRASFPVRLTLSPAGAGTVRSDVALYGPGDVIGLDIRAIVRTEPRRHTTNFAPDQLAAIEFDPPDLPWMFTPARAAAGDRLRPWLVLIVVRQQDGVTIDLAADRPLPRLTIRDPAIPADELPDLAESWAWAHAHVVEDGATTSVPQHLVDEPDLNVSRLLCPRRLVPGVAYYACLVPAFEAGRLAGLGQPVPETATTAAAWGSSGSVGATMSLPLYYHWEFRTGPAGDFESLARQLTPRPIPPTVGKRKMFVGAADPALPAIPPEAGGILELEGALRAPEAGAGGGPPPPPALVAALTTVLDAPSQHVVSGASPDAEAVAPPIHGQWHARQHTVPATRPRWLRELNLDPRHRAAAGLGAAVVRANQDEYMHAAWEQVGEVMRANDLLNLARLLRRVAVRTHQRHVAPMRAEVLFSLTGPMHARVRFADRTLALTVDRTVLPAGATDASFRRMSSPQSRVLKRAAQLAQVPTTVDGSVEVAVVGALARGALGLDLTSRTPDGLRTSTLLSELQPTAGEQVPGAVVGMPGTAPRQMLVEARQAETAASTAPLGPLRVRPNLAISGFVVDEHVRRLRVTVGPGIEIGPVLERMIGAGDRRLTPVGFVVEGDEVLMLVGEGADGTPERTSRLLVTRPPVVGGPVVRPPATGAPVVVPPTLRPPITEGPVVVEPPIGRPPIIEGPVIEGPVIEGPVLRPPIKEPVAVNAYIEAFGVHRAAHQPGVMSVVPTPTALDLGAVRTTLVTATDPAPVVVARVMDRIAIGGTRLTELVPTEHVRPTGDLGPVMVGPQLPRPLYRDLAAHDQDRFLPGAGQIPADTVTLLETNPRFVEAFLVGANHEMNREMQWRGYPTDRRATPFRRFWDRVGGAVDIGPIHEFGPTQPLGANSTDQLEGSLVLLVRGELLRRYPNSVVYATPSRADRRLDPSPATILLPVFAGQLDPDITFVGFDLTVEDITPEPGWFFVIQEQPTEPRFGLDAAPVGAPGPLATWSDLNWGHVGVAPGEYLRIADSGVEGTSRPLAVGAPSARFATNSAHAAAITFQRQFRAAIHGHDVLAGMEGDGRPRLRRLLPMRIRQT